MFVNEQGKNVIDSRRVVGGCCVPPSAAMLADLKFAFEGRRELCFFCFHRAQMKTGFCFRSKVFEGRCLRETAEAVPEGRRRATHLAKARC